MYRIAEAAEVLGVSDDTVRRWIDGGRLTSTVEAGRTVIAGPELASFAASLVDSAERERIGAGAVSARNRMAGIVTRVVQDTVMAQIDVVCGHYRMVSLMSTEAAVELGLTPGARAIVSVKSTNVIVERTLPRSNP